MLPFLKQRKVAGLIISQRKPEGGLQESPKDTNNNDGLRAVSRDILTAIKNDDEEALSKAIEAAFELYSSEAPSKGPEINEI